MHTRSITISALVVLTLAACGRTDTPVPVAQTSTPSPELPVGASPLSPPATATPAPPESTSPLPDPSSSPIEAPSGAEDQVVGAAKAHLARELGVALDRIEVIAIEPVEWSDTSLGCPQPGQVYAQVITPGYRIMLQVDGRAHELHTDQDGRAIVICELKLEKGPAAGVAYLADRLGIPAEEIEVLSVEMVEWPDTSLGCPEPGASYAQVVTPGYRIIMRARGEKYDVHTDMGGQILVICEPEL